MNDTMGTGTTRKAILAALAVAAVWTLAGCDAADGPDHPGDPLWSLTGRIAQAPSDLGSDALRAAFVWERRFPDGGVVLVAQDVAVDAQFPASFTIPVYDLPPEAAMIAGEQFDASWQGIRVAVGRLVIYGDRNRNGLLDTLPKDATQAVDRVYGPTEWYVAVFVEGDATGMSLDGEAIAAGLNLFLLDPTLTQGSRKVDVSKVLEVSLDAAAEDLQFLMCREPVESASAEGNNLGEVAFGQIPEGARFTCGDDSRQVDFSVDRTVRATPCGTVTYTSDFGTSTLQPGEAVPSGWPCEA